MVLLVESKLNWNWNCRRRQERVFEISLSPQMFEMSAIAGLPRSGAAPHALVVLLLPLFLEQAIAAMSAQQVQMNQLVSVEIPAGKCRAFVVDFTPQTVDGVVGKGRALKVEVTDEAANTAYVAGGVPRANVDDVDVDMKASPGDMGQCVKDREGMNLGGEAHTWSDDQCWGTDIENVRVSGYAAEFKDAKCKGFKNGNTCPACAVSLGPQAVDMSNKRRASLLLITTDAKKCTTYAGRFYVYVVASDKGVAKVKLTASEHDAELVCKISRNMMAIGLGVGAAVLACCACCGYVFYARNCTKSPGSSGQEMQEHPVTPPPPELGGIQGSTAGSIDEQKDNRPWTTRVSTGQRDNRSWFTRAAGSTDDKGGWASSMASRFKVPELPAMTTRVSAGGQRV